LLEALVGDVAGTKSASKQLVAASMFENIQHFPLNYFELNIYEEQETKKYPPTMTSVLEESKLKCKPVGMYPQPLIHNLNLLLATLAINKGKELFKFVNFGATTTLTTEAHI